MDPNARYFLLSLDDHLVFDTRHTWVDEPGYWRELRDGGKRLMTLEEALRWHAKLPEKCDVINAQEFYEEQDTFMRAYEAIAGDAEPRMAHEEWLSIVRKADRAACEAAAALIRKRGHACDSMTPGGGSGQGYGA